MDTLVNHTYHGKVMTCSKKSVLVTGATGYIGSHVVKRLCEHGYAVTGADFNLNQNDISPYVDRLIEWDIREFLPIEGFDVVVHLAALTRVSDSVRDPESFYKTNVDGTFNVATSVSTDHFIFCSTGSAFYPESSPYAASKKIAEDGLKCLVNAYTFCRFYNVSGNEGFKKFDDERSHLIRRLAATANGLYPDFRIFGRDYPTRDGTAVRSYVHVSDVADAIVRIVDNGPTNRIECFGTTEGYTVEEVFDTMVKVSGKNILKIYEPRRLGDIAASTIPETSKFFIEARSLEDQCRSALRYEI